jgi:tellurite methyltransferase
MAGSPWSGYYNDTIDKEPNKTAVFAEKGFSRIVEKYALDIGSGTGCDSVYLLERGFHVTSLDQETAGLKILRNRAGPKHSDMLTLVHARMQNYPILPDSYDLINASFSLPFCAKDDFKIVWKNIFQGLKKNGVFAGQLFGFRDAWYGLPEMSFVTNEEVDALMDGYSPEYYVEIDEDGRIADGSVKHWHLFNIVLRKK